MGFFFTLAHYRGKSVDVEKEGLQFFDPSNPAGKDLGTVKATCAKCGNTIDVPADGSRKKCPHCGETVRVKR